MDRITELLAALSDASLTDERRAELDAELAEALGELDDEQLAEAQAAVVAAFDEIMAGDLTDEALAAAAAHIVVRDAITAEDEQRAAAVADIEARAAALQAQMHGETAETEPGEGDPEPEGDPPAEGEPEPEGEPEAEPEGETPPATAEQEPELEPVTAATRRRPSTRPAISTVASRVPARNRPRPAQDERPRGRITSLVATQDFDRHQELTRDQMAEALVQAAENLRGGRFGSERVARVSAPINDRRALTADAQANEALFRGEVDSITAAGGLCAILQPLWDVINISDDSRPFTSSLPSNPADRGGFQYMPSPRLGDYVANQAVWTADNDADPGSDGPETKPCVRVDCDDIQTVTIEAFPNCVTIGNFYAMTYDERVQVILDLVSAEHARFQESRMLTKVGAGSTNVTIGLNVIGAAADFFSSLDRLKAAFYSRWRARRNVQLRLAVPEWLRDLLRADLAREMPGAASERLAVADSEIDAMFAVRRITPVWFIDGEAGQIFGLQGAGDALPWPGVGGGDATEVVGYLYHEGAWHHATRNRLDLGIVRDSSLNEVNDLQIWSEEFENVFFRGIESLRVTFDLCPNGSRSGTVDLDVCASGS